MQTATANALCKYQVQATTYTSSGIYYNYAAGPGGCDAVTITNLTIQPFVTSVSQSGNALVCNDANASYQWYFCSPGINIPISGETSQTFIPSSAIYENYAVVVTSADGCVDISDCKPAMVVGLNTLNAGGSGLRYFPNPVKNKLTIELQQATAFITVEVFDALGKPVQQITVKDIAVIDFELAVEPGIYFATVKTSSGQKSIKIIKE